MPILNGRVLSRIKILHVCVSGGGGGGEIYYYRASLMC